MVAVVAIIATLSLQTITSPSDELLTECFSWCIILLVVTAYLIYSSASRRPFHPAHLNVVAFGAAMICVSSSINYEAWFAVSLKI
jgi:hypothetical protein